MSGSPFFVLVGGLGEGRSPAEAQRRGGAEGEGGGVLELVLELEAMGWRVRVRGVAGIEYEYRPSG